MRVSLPAFARPFVLIIACGIIIYVLFLRFSGLARAVVVFSDVDGFRGNVAGGIAGLVSAENDPARFCRWLPLLITFVERARGVAVVRTRATSIDLVAQVLQRKATAKRLVLTMPWYYGVTLGPILHRNSQLSLHSATSVFIVTTLCKKPWKRQSQLPG